MNWLASTSVSRTLRRHYGKGGGRLAGLCLAPAGSRTPTAARWRCYKPAGRESYSRWRLLPKRRGRFHSTPSPPASLPTNCALNLSNSRLLSPRTVSPRNRWRFKSRRRSGLIPMRFTGC